MMLQRRVSLSSCFVSNEDLRGKFNRDFFYDSVGLCEDEADENR